MKKFIFCLLPFAFCLLNSCNYSTEYQTINANNKFSITIPSWMKEDETLKEGADFQYDNRFRNFYAIGESADNAELKRTVAETMHDNIEVIKKSMKNPVVSDSASITISGLSGLRAEIFGKMNNENIYFSEVLLEGKTRTYHLSIWTRGEDRKLRYKEDINKILNSFKEI